MLTQDRAQTFAPYFIRLSADPVKSFIERCHQMLDDYPVDKACTRMARLLTHFLNDPHFVDRVSDIPGRHVMYEEPAGLTILGHYHPEQVRSPPHDHGRTWAIYGVAQGFTAMIDWQKIDETHVRPVRDYWLSPGQAMYYPVGAIHSHLTKGVSRLVRIEGVNIHRETNNLQGHTFEPVL